MENKIDYVIRQYINLYSFEKINMITLWDSLDYFKDKSKNCLDLLNVESLKKTELSKLCKKYNQKVSGNKPDLIKRLKKTDSYHFYTAFITFINKYTNDSNKRKQLISKWDSNTFDFSNYQNKDLKYCDLISHSLPVLVGLCKKYKLKNTGKRDILIERLDQFANGKVRKKKKIKNNKNVVFQKKEGVKFLYNRKTYEAKKIEIKDISSGLFYFVNNKLLNNLVLNNNHLVVGKLNIKKTKIINLSKKDIKICNSHDLSYNIPDNLD